MRFFRLIALVAVCLASLVPIGLLGQSALISVPARRDIVFDHAGHYLYITTSDGFVQRYNLVTSQLDSPFNLGGSLNGADITADDSFLLVAQQQLTGTGQGKFQRLTLNTAAVTDIPFSTQPGELGGYSVKIAANGIALTSTREQFGGLSVPLRAIDVASGSISVRNDIGQISTSKEFYRSADGTLLFTNGGGLRYNSSSNSFSNGPVTVGAATLATSVDRTGTMFARVSPFYGGSLDTVSDLTFIHAFRQMSAGVAFDPTRDVVYSVDREHGWLVGWDSNTFKELFRLNLGEEMGPSYNFGGFGPGRLVVSPNGHYLALSTPSGVRLFSVPAPPYPPLDPDYGEPRAIVFDHDSKFFYATTTTGYVLGFNVATTGLERIYHTDGWLYGIDIAPDDSFLLVAQAYFGMKQGAIQKIDLGTGASTNFRYERGSSERGALDIHIAANGRALFSTSVDSDDGQLRQIDLATGAVTARPAPLELQLDLRGNFQIQRSADRNLFYILDPNSSGGSNFTYHAASDSFGPGGDIHTYFDLTSAAVNRDGTMAALRYANTVELQAGPDLHTVHSFADFFGGVAFNAKQDVLYALTTTTDEIVAYDTNTYAELFRMWIGEDLPGTLVGKLFGIGSLFPSQDGRYLALLSPTAISLFDLQNPPGPRSNYTISVMASPANGGTVTGGGTFPLGGHVALTATPNPGFVFAGYTENGVLVNAEEGYGFNASRNRNLVVNFLPTPTITITASPRTVRKGGSALFTVSRGTANPAKLVQVNYIMSGPAIPGVDYTLTPETFITIPAGQASATARLTVITTKTKKSEKATMVLQGGVNYKLAPTKKKKNPNQATVTIQNR